MSNFEFICGSAGTGKTFLARQRINDISRGCILTATTGIAAVNLGDAVTINSLLKYYDTKSLRQQYETGNLDKRLTELSKDFGIKEIIIDEVSMLSGDQLDIICGAIDFFNQHSQNSLSVTLVGDFCQLAPIKAKFAFEAKSWKRFENNTKKLNTIYRQTDGSFIAALLSARSGDGSVAAKLFSENFTHKINLDFVGTTIMAKNEEVENFNRARLEKINKLPINFYAKKTNKQLSEWKNIPDILIVKDGALVMLLANKYQGSDIEYVNGDLGYFINKIDDNTAEVQLIRTGEIVKVKSIIRYNEESKKGVIKKVGEVKYLPLRLAFASTVHKSQGLTLDKIQINIRNPFIKFPGMLYVALSRARTSAGISLVGTPEILKDRCTTNPKIRKWL